MNSPLWVVSHIPERQSAMTRSGCSEFALSLLLLSAMDGILAFVYPAQFLPAGLIVLAAIRLWQVRSGTRILLLECASPGEVPVAPHRAEKMLHEFARKTTEAKESVEQEERLSAREAEIIGFVAQGLTNRDIAARLTLSENTIKYHLKNILQKLHLRNRAQAVAFAMQRGLIKSKRT